MSSGTSAGMYRSTGSDSGDEIAEVEAAEAPATGVVLLQRDVEGRRRCHEQEPELRGRRSGDLQDVVVGGREPFAEEAGPLLGDPADLRLSGVVDREVPRAPVLRVDPPEQFAVRSAEREMLLAQDVVLRDHASVRSA